MRIVHSIANLNCLKNNWWHLIRCNFSRGGKGMKNAGNKEDAYYSVLGTLLYFVFVSIRSAYKDCLISRYPISPVSACPSSTTFYPSSAMPSLVSPLSPHKLIRQEHKESVGFHGLSPRVLTDACGPVHCNNETIIPGDGVYSVWSLQSE